MARTPNVRIIEWGTPPEPEPTGWDAVAAELDAKPGEWASVGVMSAQTARTVARDRLTVAAGYELRTVAGRGDSRQVTVWVRRVDPAAPAESAEIETRAAADAADAPPPPARVKRGAVV